MSKNQGDITVIGNVGGIHLLEDIKVNVPCGVSVHIPAEMVLRSRDLQIALQKRLVRRAPREAGAPVVKKPQPFAVVPTAHVERASALEEENRRLRLQLQEAQRRLLVSKKQEELQQRQEELQREQEELERKKSEGFQKQLDAITASLKRLEDRPSSNTTVVMSPEGTLQQATPVAPRAPIEDDTPSFIQDMNVKADDVSIELESKGGGGEDILKAAKRLKSLREKRGK